jgi:hypothetical protein
MEASIAVLSCSASRSSADEGIGMILIRKHPAIMGSDVPRESNRRNEEIFSANATCAMMENMNADNPKPDTTRPVAVARCVRSGRDAQHRGKNIVSI